MLNNSKAIIEGGYEMKRNEFFEELDKLSIENKNKQIKDYIFEKEKNENYD